MSIEAIRTNNNQQRNHKKDGQQLNKTLQGVLVDSHLKLPCSKKFDFDDIQNSLLINNSEKYYSSQQNNHSKKNDSVFDVKKAVLPLLAGTAVLAGGSYALSVCLKKSSSGLLKTKSYEHLPDLAINMNIREEPQFAIYRTIRDPNFRNIIGAVGVFLMSGITIACQNFIEGSKDIWIKKQNADIEKNLQENLINVERDAFSGKLKVVNDMMNNNVKYFEKAINSKPDLQMLDIASFRQEKTSSSDLFGNFSASFKGEKNNTDNDKNKKSNEENIKNSKFAFAVGATVAICALLGKLSYSNLKKTIQNTQSFANKYSENTINAIENMSNKPENKDIPQIIELMKSICIKPQFIKEIGKKYKLSQEEIDKIIDSVNESKKTIFADAPTALGGIPKKVQYYCYIDEPRGHFYNWLLNPENKFTKQIFLAFTISGAIGYLFKQAMDAIKEVTVLKENAKTELDLKKRLVNVEIENFKAKKESAINPLVDSFTHQVQSGHKSKEELKQIADNILMEIKNGPPYVYS